MNDRDWKDLDPHNLPSDLLVPGAWEIEYRSIMLFNREAGVWKISNDHITHLLRLVGNTIDIRIRRPADWKPSKCPLCGARNKEARHYINDSPCSNPWHDEPKAPTHEEIMTKWWWIANGVWQKAVGYYPSFTKPYKFPEGSFKPSYFIGRESADIPPCSE